MAGISGMSCICLLKGMNEKVKEKMEKQKKKELAKNVICVFQ